MNCGSGNRQKNKYHEVKKTGRGQEDMDKENTPIFSIEDGT